MDAESAPQFYRVACPEGHILRGQRNEGYQAIRCPVCGEGVFILPSNPLPTPSAPTPGRAQRRRRPKPVEEGPIPLADASDALVSPADAEVEIEWEEPEVDETEAADEPAAPPEAPARPAAQVEIDWSDPRPTARPTRAAKPRARPSGAGVGQRSPKGGDVAERPLVMVPRATIRQRLWRQRHRLAIVGAIALVLGTVAFRVSRQRLERLPEIAETNRKEGLEALAAGQFDIAKQKLGIAADALERLRDPEAINARQEADEATALAGWVAPKGLRELGWLEGALDELANQPDPSAWFNQKCRGRWVIIEATIQDAARRDLDYRIMAGARWGRFALDDFPLLEGKRAGDGVIFAGRLESVELGRDGVWQFRLDPESGCYITTPAGYKGLESIGFPSRVEMLAGEEAAS